MRGFCWAEIAPGGRRRARSRRCPGRGPPRPHGEARSLAHLAYLSRSWSPRLPGPQHLVVFGQGPAPGPRPGRGRGGRGGPRAGPEAGSGVRRPVSRVLSPREGRRPFLWDRPRGRPRTIYPEGMARVIAVSLPYLIFLRVGFAVPDLSPGPRCALTAPFHPYRSPREGTEAVCSLWHFPWPRGRLPLTTTLTRGARTFLPTSRRSDRPGASRRRLA